MHTFSKSVLLIPLHYNFSLKYLYFGMKLKCLWLLAFYQAEVRFETIFYIACPFFGRFWSPVELDQIFFWFVQHFFSKLKLFGPDQNIWVLVQIYFGSIEPIKWRNISLRIIVCIYRAVLAIVEQPFAELGQTNIIKDPL